MEESTLPTSHLQVEKTNPLLFEQSTNLMHYLSLFLIKDLHFTKMLLPKEMKALE